MGKDEAQAKLYFPGNRETAELVTTHGELVRSEDCGIQQWLTKPNASYTSRENHRERQTVPLCH